MGDTAGLTVTINPNDTTPPPTRRRRRRRWLVAILTVVALIAAGTVGLAALYADGVELGPMVELPQSSTLYYSDGETVLARLGTADRTELPYEEILPAVVDVTVAAEDPGFWSGSAGPITRAVIRLGYDLEGKGFNVDVRTAIMARKLEGAQSKEWILAYYLNVVPFGRNAYGIEAAARAYFGKSASTTAPPAQQLTAAEAMVLLAMVRQPYPDPTDPEGRPGYDPATGTGAEANSRLRWAEIRDSLADLVADGPARSGLPANEVSQLSYPVMPASPAGPVAAELPVGLVLSHVLAELTTTGSGGPLADYTWEAIRNGGFKITTTIDANAQAALEAAADETVTGSVMSGQPENLQAAGVVVEPGTGRVLAYFGGHQGIGQDYAGVYRGEDGELVGFGAHPPGATFMVYPLAAALQAGYSLNSLWQWTPHDQGARTEANNNRIRNSSVCPSDPNGQACSLVDSVASSLYVPLYDVTASVGVAPVIEMARAAGISAVWNDNREFVDLASAADPAASGIGLEVGFGQYPVTVLDQAAAMATLAGDGVPAPAHFVRTVTKGDELLYGEELPTAGSDPVLGAGQLADLTYALTRASGQDDLAIKTGTWEYGVDAAQNAHAWSVGFTSALAAAIWIGNRADEQALYDKDGNAVWGSGLPSQILRRVITETQSRLDLHPQPFPPPVFVGDLNPLGSVPS
jgi:membrane peptidoglycan carboxypeptidase